MYLQTVWRYTNAVIIIISCAVGLLVSLLLLILQQQQQQSPYFTSVVKESIAEAPYFLVIRLSVWPSIAHPLTAVCLGVIL